MKYFAILALILLVTACSHITKQNAVTTNYELDMKFEQEMNDMDTLTDDLDTAESDEMDKELENL